ncbi:MAG TPA: 4-(cytidine 5'-diphospho)-2-C-methyl-D-erythritol kinase [Geminicoccus sp.]|jgi:4-diphosphocytidyl-2-C-methyl-D-erythritol kinase|uniref:4-(cytidine 5'-diphospho)-2-C-methyl-D-erythritol kinase n=1 Tax=Geminicoccus sp. TaxID=2024832 RepID=UPI002E307CD1|nr:4-(cytidine 5'-diphospho)-2-C-methyl-D-erythritol kinase [Geminicoccus sp.]HEX2524837.1 4-(cytidine 5'-diphospho)-2-C-methyl-D-erythritol kinase [Geminicoccus sp.]
MASLPERGERALGEEGALTEAAPAKVNLDLLVTARRLDGYHELDSIVVFAPVGDLVRFEPAEGGLGGLELAVEGPFATDVPADGGNLVLRAAELFQRRTGAAVAGRLVLEKRLPVGAGLGGGSSDAAATLRLLDRACRTNLGNGRLRDLGAELGADVPVCVYGQSVRMRGLGERLDPIRGLPDLPLVLVNPGVHVATPAVFRALTELGEERDGGMVPHPGPRVLASFLAESRNDLEPAAIGLAPVIDKVLQSLRVLDGCALARMSGSGATCFGLFPEEAQAVRAAQILRQAVPGWWVEAVVVRGEKPGR